MGVGRKSSALKADKLRLKKSLRQAMQSTKKARRTRKRRRAATLDAVTFNTIEIRDGASTLSQAIPVSMKAGKKMQYSRTSQLWIRYTYRKTKKHKGFAFKLTYKTYDCDHVCANGVCMLPDWKCNGIDECGDMSDEKNCTQPSPSKPGHGVSVGVLVAVIFIMFFLGIAVTLLIPIAYRRFRTSRYRELHDMMTPAST
ncbi:hypothetical protein LSAT2_023597 [Lamellibrachia satsuma]|nr:hypothetical protein LSAT2_023597 [Lamellibrachia satsuma]